MGWLSFVNGLAKLFNALVSWWRDKSIHDAGVKAERLRIMEAEIKAERDAEKIKPVTRDNLVERLRDAGREF